MWEGIDRIPDERLWEARQALRTYLFAFIRERARQRWKEEHVTAARVVAAGTLLDPSALTIGFARRFTGYKRSELIFHNPERLVGILTASRRPVQIVFAGKAHPADETGKHNIQKVYRRAIDPMFAGRIAFVDDYDLHVAHFLVQGCDVWLNNPRKPLEASGTSGMKASINGVPHLSIGDGWWAEGYTGAERLADRRPRRESRCRRRRRRRRRSAVSAARARRRADLLRPRRAGRPEPVVRDRAPGHHVGDAAILGAAHGEGVRGGHVFAGDAAAHGAGGVRRARLAQAEADIEWQHRSRRDNCVRIERCLARP